MRSTVGDGAALIARQTGISTSRRARQIWTETAGARRAKVCQAQIRFRMRISACRLVGRWTRTRSGRARQVRRNGCARLEVSQPFAPLAQLDRASGYEPGGRTFESCRARQLSFGELITPCRL